MEKFHLHLISDSTGETLATIARAVWARFDLVEPLEHIYALTRTKAQIEEALVPIQNHVQQKTPVLVMCTLVDDTLTQFLEKKCAEIKVPCIAVLDDIVARIDSYLGVKIDRKPSHQSPGGQHAMDNAYFRRVQALSWTLAHDDGQQLETIDEADIILLGLSRTSKTPTCFYLAHRGVKAGNIPLVPDVPLDIAWDKLTKPLIVGLTLRPTRLVQVRQQRFSNKEKIGDYTHPASVAKEVEFANKLFTKLGCPVIDVTQHSIEESAAAILNLKRERDEEND